MFRLRTRLLLAYLAALIPLAAAFGWVTFTVARAGLEAELGRSLALAAGTVAAEFNASPDAGRIARLTPDSTATRERLRGTLTAVRDETGVRRIRILDSELRALVDTDPVEPFDSYFDLEGERREIDAVLATGDPMHSVLFHGADGTPYERGYAAVSHEGAVVAVVSVEGSAAYFTVLTSLRVQIAIFGLLTLLMTVVVTILVSGRITAPLERLGDVARRVGGGELQVEVPKTGDDEIGRLAAALREMQRNLRARDEEAQMMLAGIAHEVRNPLGGIELFVGLLEESLDDDGDARRYAARVRNELNYLTHVVEEFLLYARERALELGRGRADELLENVRSATAASFASFGVEFETRCEPADTEITGDLSALRGVIINLVQNAAQASDAGASVVVAVGGDDGHRRIEVSDSGRGIPPDQLADVFRPFYTTREKGTGLGLPLARKIIERHGGTIDIESSVGQGTRVVIALPFDPAIAPAVRRTEAKRISLDSGDYDGEMIG